LWFTVVDDKVNKTSAKNSLQGWFVLKK